MAPNHLIAEYHEVIRKFIAGRAIPSDFAGWSDAQFHRLLYIEVSDLRNKHEAAARKAVMFDGLKELFAQIGSGVVKHA